MSLSIDTPIYINKNLIVDLHSILINGFIESRAVRFIEDRADLLKLQKGCKNSEGLGKKKSNNDKDKNVSKDSSINYSEDFAAIFDNRNATKNEISIKQIFTTFQIFFDLRDIMLEKNILKSIGNNNIMDYNIYPGEFIEFEGCISPTSPLSQINTMIDIFEAYDCKDLDELLRNEDVDEPLNNYSVMLKQMKNLSACLNRNNTVNMLMDCNSFTSVLNVNANNFSDKNAYMYDTAHCPCKVLCKVIRVIDKNDHIDLLCKTCMSDYYVELFNQMKPSLDLLAKNNIILPREFTTKIQGPAIQVMPLAMYV
ncbi:hypothetical protein [uncultured Clostridium sp.]|uniref:DUF6414 family protein n=1 Tax=uncultured Clostridium sp. TaxID=59620 RepID=UPI0028E53774|nr:hypothetical protein [uncultured Clostridium sp.]